jgi:hypothetical protein
LKLTEGDYRDFLIAARRQAALALPGAELEAAGSLATGELVPGLSDLDIVVSVPTGRGPATRDSIPLLGRQLGHLLTIFVDPFSAIGTVCSVYPGPLKVDWFIREGKTPPPSVDLEGSKGAALRPIWAHLGLDLVALGQASTRAKRACTHRAVQTVAVAYSKRGSAVCVSSGTAAGEPGAT